MTQGTNPHALHDTAKGLYEDKTGDWVFETPEWDKWINCRERALWIHGIPGAGKTILASHVIDKTLSICETKGKQARCIYYYCHHSHNQDETTPFLRWLIIQLLQGLNPAEHDGWEWWSTFNTMIGVSGRCFDNLKVVGAAGGYTHRGEDNFADERYENYGCAGSWGS